MQQLQLSEILTNFNRFCTVATEKWK